MNIQKLTPTQFVDESMKLTPQIMQYFDTLENQLNSNLSDNGYFIPQQTTANINAIAAANPSGFILIADSTTNQLKLIKNGVVIVLA